MFDGFFYIYLRTPSKGDNFLYTEATVTSKLLPLLRGSIFEFLQQRVGYEDTIPGQSV
jgi:hypothetical protein